MNEEQKKNSKVDYREVFPGFTRFILIFFGILISSLLLPDVLPYIFASKTTKQLEILKELSTLSETIVTGQEKSIRNLPLLGIATLPKQSITTKDSSEMFEAYGRFITLLVAIFSVIGVFFAYFVRRSIRETEKDMQDALDRRLEEWKKVEENAKELIKKLDDYWKTTESYDREQERPRQTLEQTVDKVDREI